MKKALSGIIVTLVVLLILCTGIFANLVKFFCWLFLLQYSAPETSIAGGIIVRILSFVVAYGLVGVILSLFGFFNSKLMSTAYFIICTILGFVFAYIVYIVETHILAIGIVFGIVLIGIIIFFIVKGILNCKKQNNFLSKR